ncbi:hypothetical protein EV209_1774 [Cuneatibacter caecimuris]|uniref:Uncharacterized protein n=1 Tax=Cuneatibacter caecimuris TaxID=1796618 RepID=A0A4Q7PN35_9FIRM|nr:hypothetical protein EV209_1774 [Cuneatibacter caecimuris]
MLELSKRHHTSYVYQNVREKERGESHETAGSPKHSEDSA